MAWIGFIPSTTSSDGDITDVTAGTGMIGGGTTGAVTLNLVGGDGITANANDMAVTATQTTVTSMLNASLVIGRDADNDIDFTTDNNIRFRVGGEDQLTLVDGALTPTTNNIVDLGTDALEFKDGYFDGTLEADAITIGGTNVVTGSLITTLGTISAGVWNGTAIASAYLDADTAHLSGSQTFTGTKTLNSFKGTGSVTVTDILDSDTMSGANATTLATSESIKAYVDSSGGGGAPTSLGTITQDTVLFTSANADDPLIQIKNTTNDATGARLQFVKDKGGAGADGDDIGIIEFVGDDAAQTQTTFAKIVAEVSEADDTDEAGKLSFYVAESDGTTTALAAGLVLEGEHATDGQVDVAIAAGTASTTTISGDLQVVGGNIIGTTDGDIQIDSDDDIILNVDNDADAGNQLIKFQDNGTDYYTFNVAKCVTEITSLNPEFRLTSTSDNAFGNYFDFVKQRIDSTTQIGEAGDTIGTISWYGYNDGTPALKTYATMLGKIADPVTGAEAGDLTLQVASYDGVLTNGLQLLGDTNADGEVDVTIASGAASTTTIAGTLTMGSTAALTNAGLVAVANQSSITGLGTITSGTWTGTAVASAYLDADTAHLSGTQTFSGAKTFSAATGVVINDATTSSATEGGNLVLASDDGAVMADNHRLGVIEFKGAEDTSNTLSTGARIQAIARDTWDGSNNDTDLEFYTTDGTTESKVLTLDADKLATFAGNLVVTGTVIGSPGRIRLNPAEGSDILLDGTISIDAGVITDATSITSTAFVGDITGDVTGQADTVATIAGLAPNTATTQATQPNIESIGTDGDTLAILADDINISNSTASKPVINITNTHDGTTSGELRFNKDSTGDDNDIMGLISFYGTDSSDNAHERLAYMDAIITDSAHGSEASSLRFFVAENDATLTQGLSIAGQADADGEVDVTIAAGAASTTTIAGTLTMGSTAAMTNAGLLSVVNQSNITGLGTITSGTWTGTAVASAYLDADTAHLTTDQTFTGVKQINKRKFTVTSDTHFETQGDIVYLGSGSTTAGELCYLKADGAWAATDADAVATSGGVLLALALGTDPDADGMLLRGMFTLDHDPGTIADELYISTTAGDITATAPSATGDIVRVIGYCLDSTNGQIWFNPSNDFIVLA